VLAEPGLVGLRQVAGEAGLHGVVEGIADRPVDAVRPHGPLPAGQVAQQAAKRFMALGDLLLVGAFEGDAARRQTRR